MHRGCGIDIKDDGKVLPEPATISEVKTESVKDIVTLVDVDFGEYRRKNEWLNFEAEKAGVNFSAILTSALKREIKIQNRQSVQFIGYPDAGRGDLAGLPASFQNVKKP